MSLLICTICEKNRQPITETTQEIHKTLGQKAVGSFKIKPKQVCVSGKVWLYQVFDDDTLPIIAYNYTIDNLGDYEILAPEFFVNNQEYAHYNHLHIMQRVIEFLASQLV